MKIGIFVYSQTGNTLSVAEKLRDAMAQNGLTAVIERITAVGDVSQDVKKIRFECRTDVNEYDGLVLASFVQAFTLNPVMSAWLDRMPLLSGKKVACFVTKKFGNDWTGGAGAIRRMSGAVQGKGGVIAGSGIVHWGSRKDEEAAALSDRFCTLFQ